jgi:hypothetical protein
MPVETLHPKLLRSIKFPLTVITVSTATPGANGLPLKGEPIYAGDPIPFDPAGVYPMKPNRKIADFAPGALARTPVEKFSYGYSRFALCPA